MRPDGVNEGEFGHTVFNEGPRVVMCNTQPLCLRRALRIQYGDGGVIYASEKHG